jgi:stage II sporulation SpoE-like protein
VAIYPPPALARARPQPVSVLVFSGVFCVLAACLLVGLAGPLGAAVPSAQAKGGDHWRKDHSPWDRDHSGLPGRRPGRWPGARPQGPSPGHWKLPGREHQDNSWKPWRWPGHGRHWGHGKRHEGSTGGGSKQPALDDPDTKTESPKAEPSKTPPVGSSPSKSTSSPATSPPSPSLPSVTTPAGPVHRLPPLRPGRGQSPGSTGQRTERPTVALRPGGGGAGTLAGGAAGLGTSPALDFTPDSSATSPAASGKKTASKDAGAGSDQGSPVTRTVRDIVEVVPSSVKRALAALAALSLLLGAGSLFSALRARRLGRQRRELLQEVGLLQGALLPSVPQALGALRTSVAYRPADGPGAGGDFYDALPLPGGRAGFILGDVSGHGRGALASTAFMRYTLRAYLEAGLEPRVALQVAGRVVDDRLGGDFATVLLAVHDPESSSLTFASAGHPPPIVVGGSPYEPILVGSSPPIGVGMRTGLRQSTVPLAPGAVACFHTDGLTEARTSSGILGRPRLQDMVAELGRDATAEELIGRVAGVSRITSDDMATCLLTPTSGVTAGGFRSEQLELSAEELEGPLATRFFAACEVPPEEAGRAAREARELADRFGGVVVNVVFGNRRTVEVLPRNVESIEAASRRAAASG